MTIKRVINGHTWEFDLTTEELTKAYYEAQEQFDIEDMESYAEHFLEYCQDYSAEQVSEHIQEIAREYRKYEDEHDWWYSAENAYRYVLDGYKEV